LDYGVFARGDGTEAGDGPEEKFCATAGLFNEAKAIFWTRISCGDGCWLSVGGVASFQISEAGVGSTVCRE